MFEWLLKQRYRNQLTCNIASKTNHTRNIFLTSFSLISLECSSFSLYSVQDQDLVSGCAGHPPGWSGYLTIKGDVTLLGTAALRLGPALDITRHDETHGGPEQGSLTSSFQGGSGRRRTSGGRAPRESLGALSSPELKLWRLSSALHGTHCTVTMFVELST